MRQTMRWVAVLLLSCATAWSQVGDLPRSTPEEQGIPSAVVAHLLDTLIGAPGANIHSVMILRHGKVIAEVYPEPWKAEYRHTMYSCSKTFVSVAVGLAVDEHKLRVTDRVVTFFPEYKLELMSPELASMTVRDLLIMASGIAPDEHLRAECSDWTRAFLSKPVKTPGRIFKYDSLCTYLLSAILQRVTGMKTLDYLKEHLFKYMNITEVGWEESPEGYNVGGWGLHIQCESMAKLGQLLLQKGRWGGRQLVSESWVHQMMKRQIPVNHRRTKFYGYQMWSCTPRRAYCADGRLGQYILVMPEQDMVVAITECAIAPQLHLVWEELLPHLSDEPLEQSEESERLKEKMASYRYLTPEGTDTLSMMKEMEGRVYEFTANEFGWKTLSFEQHDGRMEMKVLDKYGRRYSLSLGYGEWLTSEIAAYPLYSMNARQKFKGLQGPFYVAGSYAWRDDALNVRLEYVNWISAAALEIRPIDDRLVIRVRKSYQKREEEMWGREVPPKS